MLGNRAKHEGLVLFDSFLTEFVQLEMCILRGSDWE